MIFFSFKLVFIIFIFLWLICENVYVFLDTDQSVQ